MPATDHPPTPPTNAAPQDSGAQPAPGSTQLTIEQALAAAVSFQRQKQLPQAEAILQAVLDAEPASPDALHFMGVLRHQQGRREEAVDLIRRAIELSPQYADAHNNLGNVLRAMERYAEALEAFDRAAELAPNLAEAHMNRAGLLRRCNRLPEATASFRRAVGLNPQLSQAHLHLGNALYMMGHIEEAAQAFANWQQIEPDNPIARHMAAACGAGMTPDRASDDYVRQSFDTFAEAFDAKMDGLNYQAPALIADVVAARYTPGADLDVLDAGCGTGLCAPILAPYARHLVGVDLSAGMVEKARARGVYHDLVVAELTAFLADGPAARYDLIISADTVVYFGALELLLAAAAGALRPGGHLVFTVESQDAKDGAAAATDEAPGFILHPHGRYAHRESYVRRCAERAGLADVEVVRQTLRLEMGQPVHGFVVAARKPGTTPAAPPEGAEK